jgi:hypothetical protein
MQMHHLYNFYWHLNENGLTNMHQFTVIHDGSTPGWRAAYLAFHVAVQFGAPLQVLIIEDEDGQNRPAEKAAQTEIGGRAAGLAIETHIVKISALDTILNQAPVINGLFVPRHLVTGEARIEQILETSSCPLWVVAEETEPRKMAVLISDLAEDEDLLAYALSLSQRMAETLSCLVIDDSPPPTTRSSPNLSWISLHEFTAPAIRSAVDTHSIDLLVIGSTDFPLVEEINCSCVVFPRVSIPNLSKDKVQP